MEIPLSDRIPYCVLTFVILKEKWANLRIRERIRKGIEVEEENEKCPLIQF
jgi:hypothetical protein